jgi:hypothetical protein
VHGAKPKKALAMAIPQRELAGFGSSRGATSPQRRKPSAGKVVVFSKIQREFISCLQNDIFVSIWIHV